MHKMNAPQRLGFPDKTVQPMKEVQNKNIRAIKEKVKMKMHSSTATTTIKCCQLTISKSLTHVIKHDQLSLIRLKQTYNSMVLNILTSSEIACLPFIKGKTLFYGKHALFLLM